MKNILEIKNLNVDIYKDKEIIYIAKNINLEVKEGEVLGIIGESGSGKTIAMKAIMDILSDGAVRTTEKLIINGVDLTNLEGEKSNKIRGKEITMIFQDPMRSLNPLKKIGAQIQEVIIRHSKVDKKEAIKKAIGLLEEVGIKDAEKRMDNYPHEFSGGMIQRVIIAMALACNPKVLIADEPTTALDVTVQAQILKLFKKIQADSKMSIVFITHDMGIVSEICDRIAVMYAGFILEKGKVEDLLKNPKHPYTKALLEAVPDLDPSKTKLKEIKGSTPALNKKIEICPFYNRCGSKINICKEVMPDYIMLDEYKGVKCHLYRKFRRKNE